MTAPAQTSPAGPPLPVSALATANLRKDDPRTAVELWKKRLAATPEAVAFRYLRQGRLAGDDVPRGRRDRPRDRRRAGGARAWCPGDRVCIVSQTRLEWVLCDVAILFAGAIAVPIYASNTAEQCEFIVRDAGAKIVMVEDATQRDKLVGLRNKLFTVAHLIQLTGRGARRVDAAARGAGRAAELAVRAVARRAARGGPTVGGGAPGRAGRARRDRHPGVDVHDHLYVGDDGHPQGGRADARQPGRRGLQRDPGHEDRRRSTCSTCFCRSRTCSGASSNGAPSRWAARRPSRAGTSRSRRTWSRSGRRSWPAFRASSRSSTAA